MKLAELLLFAVVGWTLLGAVSVFVSLARGRRAEAVRHAAWLAAVLGLYLVVLLTVSGLQPQRSVPEREDQCFDDMCFAVVHVDEVPSLVSGDPGRVLRVAIRVSNRGRSAHSEGLVRAYLIDSKGRTWQPLPGLSGNHLTARISGGSQVVSQPMFRVAPDSTALSLVFTHGHWQPGRLTLGDSDSLGHKPSIVPLETVPLATTGSGAR